MSSDSLGSPMSLAVAPVAMIRLSESSSGLIVGDGSKGAAPQLDLGDGSRQIAGAEPLRLSLEELHELRAQDALREAGEVLDLGGDGELPARLVAGDQHRLEAGAGGVERRGVAGGAAADDGDLGTEGIHGRSTDLTEDRSLDNSALPGLGLDGIALSRMDVASLQRVALFEGLNQSQLEKIGALLTERECTAGQKIFEEGELGQNFFVVLSGQVRISKRVPGVGEEALAILSPGDHFGEMALVDDTPRSADALAHSDCKLAEFQRQDFDQLMFMDKEIAYAVLWTFVRTLSARLRDTNEKIKGFFLRSRRGF